MDFSHLSDSEIRSANERNVAMVDALIAEHRAGGSPNPPSPDECEKIVATSLEHERRSGEVTLWPAAIVFRTKRVD
jgi:hypothetical protein